MGQPQIQMRMAPDFGIDWIWGWQLAPASSTHMVIYLSGDRGWGLVHGVVGPRVHHVYGNTYPAARSGTRALQMQPHSAIQAAKGETEKRGINQQSGASMFQTKFRRQQWQGRRADAS